MCAKIFIGNAVYIVSRGILSFFLFGATLAVHICDLAGNIWSYALVLSVMHISSSHLSVKILTWIPLQHLEHNHTSSDLIP